MLITHVTAVIGPELELRRNVSLQIEQTKIAAIFEDKPNLTYQRTLKGSNLLVMPGFINAHSHIGDSVAKDVSFGQGLDKLVHPVTGLKRKVLEQTPVPIIIQGMKTSAEDMIRSGITCFADFREGGVAGVSLLRKAVDKREIKVIALGRPNRVFFRKELHSRVPRDFRKDCEVVCREADGLGLSGPNEFPNEALQIARDVAEKSHKLRGVHAAESNATKKFSYDNWDASEIERALRILRPNFLVHLTVAEKADIKHLTSSNASAVCCPRANAVIGAGFPPILELLSSEVNVALGTDNVMLNSPDMLHEMDYTSRMLRAKSQDPGAIEPIEILKMATINGAKAFGIQDAYGSVEEGKVADLIFFDLRSKNLADSKNLIASIVHRGRVDNIVAVMHEGRFVHGDLPAG